MNYRHAFHAGNAADVVKHIVLARILEHLKEKPAAFRFVDLHAGVGIYDLASDASQRTGEWLGGVGRLYRETSCEPDPLTEAAESLISPWRKAVAAVNNGVRLARYPGSPEIARRLAREQDRMAFNELHEEDNQALAARFTRERRAKIFRMDAWAAAKALLPPSERRGVVLADPPFEAADETHRLLAGLAEAHRRFATGVFVLWYPIKAQARADALARQVGELAMPKTLLAEVTVRRADDASRLNGSGLVLVNPPWGLDAELKVLLPALAHRLADHGAPKGGWRLTWLTGEHGGAVEKKKPDPGGRVRLGERGPT